MNKYVIYYHEMGYLNGEPDGTYVWYYEAEIDNIPNLLVLFEAYKGKEAVENIIQIIVKNKLH